MTTHEELMHPADNLGWAMWTQLSHVRWWQRVLETDWATVDEIDSALGPEYRMWEEQAT